MPGAIEPLRTDHVERAPADPTAPAPARARRSKTAIVLDDTMVEAARKTLLRHWKRAREAEPGARKGRDSEQVHDLRVALRRLRVALQVFADYLDRDAFRPFRRRLRRTARALGAVRDLDVLKEKTRRYLDTLPEDRGADLDPILAVWKTEHARARRRLIAWLDSGAFVRFKGEFDEFLRGPEIARRRHAGDRVRDMVPVALLSGWTSVRSLDESVTAPDAQAEQLHRLRIAGKRLRYTLEFFAPVLGAGADPLIERVTRLQDHLGDLQDAVVACTVLQGFLDERQRHSAPAPAVAPGVTAYLAARQREIQTQLRTFPNVWAPVRATEFKKELLALIADW